MARLSPDQLDDILGTAEVFMENGDDFRPPEDSDIPREPRLRFLAELNEFLYSQGGNAGTHAYDMMAAVEEINAGNTRVLIELIAAVVLWKTETRRGPVDMQVTFQPSDIDRMQRAYEMTAKRDGMHVTVTLTPKPQPTESWQLDEGEDSTGAREQAPAPPERPVWAVRVDGGTLIECSSREDAEAVLSQQDLDPLAVVENRHCLHETCPSNRCNIWKNDDARPGNGMNPDGN